MKTVRLFKVKKKKKITDYAVLPCADSLESL